MFGFSFATLAHALKYFWLKKSPDTWIRIILAFFGKDAFILFTISYSVSLLRSSKFQCLAALTCGDLASSLAA